MLTSWKALLVAALVVPPAGILLLWLRRGLGLGRKILYTIPLLALTAGYLVWFFGLRMELDGSAFRPILSFHKPERHFEKLEESRASAAVAEPLKITPSPSPSESVPLVKPYWTDYRGPKRDGAYAEMPVLTEWPATGLKPLWKQPIGGGYASFVMTSAHAFTIEQRRHQEVVAAYDLATGRELWKHGWDAQFVESMGGPGPRATPLWHEGRVYALGAAGELRCLNATTGSLIWRRNVLEDEGSSNLQWGTAAAPLMSSDGKLIVAGAQTAAAYNRDDGEPLWRTPARKQAYVSPMLVTLAGTQQILHVSSYHALGLSPADGSVLWEFAWGEGSDIKSAQPIVVGDDRIFLSGGYGMGAYLIQLTRDGDKLTPRLVWQSNRMKNKFNSSVLHEGHIYGFDESILACINAETGDLKWKGGRYGYGQVLLASEHLIVLSESGELALIAANPTSLTEKARFSAIDGKTWNNPAIGNGYLLVRNAIEMACFRISK